MSSKSVQIIGGPSREHAWVDGPTNALLVKVVNPSGGGPTANVNLDQYGGVAVGAGNALHVQPGTAAVFPVSDNGGSLTVDGTVAVTQSTSPWVVSGTVAVSNFPATQPVSGTVTALQGTSPWVVSGTVAVSNFPATQAVTQSTSPWVVSGTVTANQGGSWLIDVVSVVPGTDPDQLGKASGDLFVAGATGVAFYGIDLTTAQWNPVALNNTRLAINLDDGTGTAQFLSVQKAADAYSSGTDAGAVVAARVDTSTPSLATDTWDFLRLTAAGRLKTDVIGTVTVTTGTGASDLGKAEDAIHASGDTGVMALAVRQDAVSALAANGDYIPLSVNATGHLRIEASGSGITNLGKAAGASYTFGGEVGTALMTLDNGTLTWQPVLSVGNILQVGGNVAVTAVTPGTGATNLGKAEDAAHTTGDVGVMALAVRNDSGSVLAGATGDYIPLTTDAGGRLRVLTTQNGIDAVNLFGIATGLGMEIFADLDIAAGGTTPQGPPMMFESASSNPVIGTDGKWFHAFIDSNDGGIYVHVANTPTVSISGHTPGTGATSLGKAEDAAHTSGDVGVMMLAVRQDVMASLSGATGDYTPPTVDFLGRLRVMQEGGKVTYRAATDAPFAAAAGAAMFFVISGSSTKTVIIQRIRVSGHTLTAVAYHSIVAEKWSTAPTGGTSTALTKVPNDANDAAATVNQILTYTAAPTEGTLVGAVGAVRFLSQATTAAAAGFPPEIVWDFRNQGENKGVYLRGTAQCLSLAFGAAPASAVTMSIEVEWTEE